MERAPRRLLYLCLDDLSRPGAWRTHVHGITGAMARLGWTVRVAAPGSGSLDLPPGVEGAPVPQPRSRVGRRLVGQRRMAEAVAGELARFGAAAIYTRGVNTRSGWGPAAASGLPCVIEINGYAEEESPWGSRGRVGAAHREAFARAAAVTFVSAKLRADLVARYALDPQRAFVVSNGADLARFRPLPRAACRRRVGWPEDARMVLFVGSFYAHHALDVMVEAAARTVARVDARFVLAGDGPERARVAADVRRRGIGDRVRLPGAIPPDDVPWWMGAADVCALTLKSLKTPERGCSPIKLYEYMACERPVAVMVDSREVADSVRETGAGTAQVTTGRVEADAEILARDILHLLQEPDRAAVMAAAGRRAAEAMFNWDRAGRRVAAILDAVLGHGPWPTTDEPMIANKEK